MFRGLEYSKIVYARPSKRGRKLFGGLVPFGQVWRAGANEATTLETNRALKRKMSSA